MNGSGNIASFSAETVPIVGSVYFIREGDAIKIGFSENVERRLAGLQSSHHGKLNLLGTVPAAANTEQDILARFKHLMI